MLNDTTITTTRTTKRIPLRVQLAAEKLLKAGAAKTLDGALVIAWVRDRARKNA